MRFDLRRDELGQGFFIIIPWILAIILILVGLYECSTGCWGIGLALIGVGSIIGGLGGSLEMGYGSAVVGGTAGFVLLIAGFVAYQFFTHC